MYMYTYLDGGKDEERSGGAREGEIWNDKLYAAKY